MKTLLQSAAISIALALSLALPSRALAEPGDPKLVNAYGEPAGFGNLPQVIPIEAKESTWSRSQPGMGGLYLMNGSVDRRSFESLGSWQARSAAEARARVIIGPLEVLSSGPTGPLTPEARETARDEVTAQVLERIRATDREMRALKKQTNALDENGQTRFKLVAQEVAQRREALRESLRAVRANNGDTWADDRTAVAVNYNAYVQSLHQAEAVAAGTATS
jgi:hypothetical protein